MAAASGRSGSLPAERVLAGARMDPVQRSRLLEEHGLEVEQRDGWLRLHLRPGRQRGMAVVTFLVGAVFAAVPLLVPDQGFIGGVIRWVFGGFGACLLLLALYLPFNALDVRISRNRLKRVRRWLGVALRSQEIRPADLEELAIDRGASTTGSTTIYYQLVARGKFGRFKVLESIPDRSLVEAVRRQVLMAAGLKPSPSH